MTENGWIPKRPVKDSRSHNELVATKGSRLCDKFYDCLMEGRKSAEKENLECDYILFIHATSKGGIAHYVEEVFDDGFFAAGTYYGFYFPFSPITEKMAVKIKANKQREDLLY